MFVATAGSGIGVAAAASEPQGHSQARRSTEARSVGVLRHDKALLRTGEARRKPVAAYLLGNTYLAMTKRVLNQRGGTFSL